MPLLDFPCFVIESVYRASDNALRLDTTASTLKKYNFLITEGSGNTNLITAQFNNGFVCIILCTTNKGSYFDKYIN
jgi:hypothetical protein